MAKFIQKGEALDYTASKTIKTGDAIVFGTRVAVAGNDMASGETGVVYTEGVFEFAKAADLAITAGDEVYFAEKDGTVSKTTTDVDAGYAVADAAAADTTVRVKLRG